MAFSQSLDIGHSTLLNLDSQARHAIDNEFVPQADQDAIEVIQESPDHGQRSKICGHGNGMSIFGRSRTQRQLSRFNGSNASSIKIPVDVEEKKRRRLRKSKSDSTLPKEGLLNGMLKSENYTDLFHSGFTFSIEDQQKSNFGGDGSDLRVSQIEAAFQMITEEKVHNTANDNDSYVEVGNGRPDDLDVAVFSEDFKEIIDNMHSLQDKEVGKNNSEAITETANCKINVAEKHKAEEEELYGEQFDQSRFICSASLNSEAKQQIEKELQISRTEAVNVEEVLKTIPLKNDHNASHATKNRRLSFSVKSPIKKLNENKDCDLESLKRINAWNLPHSVLQEYEKKGVVKMFDWQIQCLSNPKVIFEHCNLVYSAPTSAGKSLVSEILLLKTVLERNKKVLFILPFVSVVREKMFYLQDLLTVAGYRVEGFYGGYTPPGGFDSIHVAICTIEKANSIINKLLEQGKLADIGTLVVDEVHLISDPGRGYILELLIAKVLYMSRKYGLQMQIVTMSATLANVELLKRWLDAELFITDFRPVALQEMIKIGNTIYDSKMRPLRDVTQPLQGEKYPFPAIQNDNDHVAQLCIETLLEGCSVIVFCPSKDWCENLATQLSNGIKTVMLKEDYWGKRLRAQIKSEAIEEVKKQLRDIPTGLDAVLEKMITFGCAFHHAGLTSEERDIIEGSFKSCVLKIIVATSTLSSGVNLPARRVLIRTPLFGGKQMSSLTYRQMIGRAGRTGKDTLGESILICTPANARTGQDLVQADLKPIYSCLEQESSTHLKRALLEVISSGVAITKDDIDNFVNCTLLSAEKQLNEQGKDNSDGGDELFITDALDFLKEYEFVRLQVDSDTKRESYVATRLGQACLAASMPPTDGLILFAELQKSRRCFVLESELHAVYLVTPYSVCYQLQDLDWLLFLDMWEKLTPAMKKVGELVGVKESFLVRAMRGQSKLDYKLMQIHKRFYTALALQELVNEVPINIVAAKYKCTRGMLQSLQQMSSTFAGIVTAFCNSLQWPTLSLVVAQFKERLFFGIHRDLIDLMRLPDLNHKRARALFDAGITGLVELANADVLDVEKVLYNALSFDSAKQHDNEADYETAQRNQAREFFITGKLGLTVAEGAKLLVEEARTFVQYEIGVGAIKWTQEDATSRGSMDSLHISCEENAKEHGVKRKSTEIYAKGVSEVTQPKVGRVGMDVERDLNDEKPSTSKEAFRDLRQRQTKETENKEKVLKEQNKQLVLKSASIVISSKRSSSELGKIIPKTNEEVNTKAKEVTDGTVAQIQNGLFVPPHIAKKSNAGYNKENTKAGAEPKELVPEEKREILQAVKTNKSKPLENVAKNEAQKSLGAYPKVVKPKEIAQTVNTAPHALRKSTEKSKGTKSDSNFTSNGRNSGKSNTPKSAATSKNSPQTVQLQTVPRRSPRNHQLLSNNHTRTPPATTASKAANNKTRHLDESLFLAEDSFELNTGIKNVLDAANQLNGNAPLASPAPGKSKADDEIPESQEIVQTVANSPVPAKHSVHASRLLRTTQRLKAHKSRVTKDQNNESNPSSSIEVSDLSLENSLLKNPLQLNASHILNCSKVDTASTNFKRLEVVDICGDQKLFNAALRELMEVKRFGFCVGLQQQENKRKPLIGGNLLLNQCADDATEAKDFQIDDNTFLAGCAFGVADNIVYYMNMQAEGTCKEVSAEMKCKFLRSLLTSSKCTLLCVDAKEQLKVLSRVLGEQSELRVQLEDPKEANWLLQPDKFMSFQQMTQQLAPECTALTSLCGNGRGYGSHGLDTASAILAKMLSRGMCYGAHTENPNRKPGAYRYRAAVQILQRTPNASAEFPLQYGAHRISSK
ncbi:DNA polymerase theta isoform X2 [Ceratitis capitata]|uniref:DNA polymerase theta isoform X2 n=1 Tax=Ceratitis capitata TaxID=7213 RepID=UPI000618819E|nr:DNA polymerase theta isoform X2 [Ceratitis capitata]